MTSGTFTTSMCVERRGGVEVEVEVEYDADPHVSPPDMLVHVDDVNLDAVMVNDVDILAGLTTEEREDVVDKAMDHATENYEPRGTLKQDWR